MRIDYLKKKSALLCFMAVAFSTLSLNAELIPVKLKEGTSPPYPQELKSVGQAGMAKIRVVIDETGTVTNAEVESATHEAFGLSAMETVKTWSFTPATEDGEPVSQTVSIPIQFNLSHQDRLNAVVGKELFVDINKLTDKVYTKKEIKKWIPMRKNNTRRIPYPEELKGSGISEEIAVLIIISPQGWALNPMIENLQNEELALPALRHIAGLRFQSPKKDGEKVYAYQKVKLLCSEDPAFGKKKPK